MKFIPTSLARNVSLHILEVKKNSPTLLFAGGVVGVIGGTVLACRATLKAQPVIEQVKHDIEDVKGLREKNVDHGAYPEEAFGKDLAFVYANGGYNLLKLYGPALVVGSAGLAALTCSHKTLTSRNASLTAAYAIVTEAFDSYRERVREEVGSDKEEDLYLARKLNKAINPETGKSEEFYSVDVDGLSSYACWFDESSSDFQKNPENNKLFIQVQQNFCNNILQHKGHLFLNEVYDMLGLPRTPAGAVVGWFYGSDGDNYVDFHMFDARNELFLNSWEPRVLLDFNVDGVIFDKIGT